MLTDGVGRPRHLSALLHHHRVDASDCDANIYIFDGRYDYDLGGVVLTSCDNDLVAMLVYIERRDAVSARRWT